MIPRHSMRQHAVAIIYIGLITEQTVETILDDNRFVTAVSDFLTVFELDSEILSATQRALERQAIYEKVINHYMKNWRYDRLGYIERSILLLACSELELEIQDKTIIVNEAIELAKEYGDDDSYKLINGVLDAL